MSDLPALVVANPPKEQMAIRDKCFHPSGVFIEFKKEEIEQSIPDRFEKIVAKYPDRIAVAVEGGALAYDGLNKAANRVARAVLDRDGEGQEPVALLFEHGIQPIVATLGALKAGKFYVPVDPSFPPERIASILDDCGATLLITNEQNFRAATELMNSRARLLNIDAIDASVSADNLNLSLPPDAYACVIYTSGSTGQPKGVVQNHRGILHRAMVYTNTLHICSSDRLTLLHSYSVSSSMHHLFSSLLSGASLLPFNPRLRGDLALAQWLIRERVSVYHSVPALFRQMAAALTGEEEFPHLRAITLSAAPMIREDVELYKRSFPSKCILLHLMGGTENGFIRHYFIDKATQIASSAVPVGYGVENKEVVLLGEDGQEAARNEIGEIAVRSRYLAAGYWRRPDLTRAKFLQDPGGGDERIYLTGDLGRMLPDGCLLHMGRKDFRVKIRGYRIETAEIEMALLDHGSVDEVAVVAREDQGGDARLVAYFVPKGRPGPGVSELRSFLKQRLPDYMIPSAFVMLRGMPLTPNGKVDRKALPDPGTSRPDMDTPFVPPRTAVEKELTRMWAEILGKECVGVQDSFFDLGGGSLLATKILTRVRVLFDVELPVATLFDKPTITDLAERIAQTQAGKPSGS